MAPAAKRLVLLAAASGLLPLLLQLPTSLEIGLGLAALVIAGASWVRPLPVLLRALLGIPERVPEVEAVARDGVGVFETMKLVVKQCLQLIGSPEQAPEGRSPSILPGALPSLIPGARPPAAPAVRWAEENSAEIVIPMAAPIPTFTVEAIDDPFESEAEPPPR